MAKRHKFSDYFYNSVSYLGVFLALFIFLIECFLFAIDFSAHGKNLYLGLLTYIYLPPFLILGLLMIPAGALRKRHRVLRGTAPIEPRTLRIDPSIPAHRNAVLVFLVGTAVVVLMTFIGAYKGFHYTESVEFCGVLCHKVMHPEYTTYLQSPHGRVRCVDCHVGQGADFYFKSKMTGARQAFHAIKGNYQNPVKTPVHELRPAEQTCAQCHWPGKQYNTLDFNRSYYLTETPEQPWKIRMLLNVGGGKTSPDGVHAHMNIEHDIYYAAEDERRQKISWVKSIDKEGHESVFVSPDSKWKDRAPLETEIRRMDCVDCHNRPTHRFGAPYRLLNNLMQKGAIDPAIPDIKEKGMEVLSADYKSQAEGLEAIERDLTEYYGKKHAEYYDANRGTVDEAISGIKQLFAKNMFPDMSVRWDTHPDNIGHLAAPGCFRCHDGEHVSPEGRSITKNCNACHQIVEQGPLGQTEKSIDGLEFKHPTDIGDDWKEASCTDCHTGGA